MEMHNDDKPVGRVLTRREMLTLLGGSGAMLVTGLSLPRFLIAQNAPPTPTATPMPTCVVRPELTEGPYFVDYQLNRSDIRVDPTDGSIKEGIPLRLIYRVSAVTGGMCAPLAGAQIDVWHCDAAGRYSGVQDRSFDTSGQKWLRGYQVTDESGGAEFLTIVPGWYSGRAVHIHFKIRTNPGSASDYEFTSQFFFGPATIADIYALAPYADRGLPDTPNERDGIYQQSGGALTLDLTPMEADELDELGVRLYHHLRHRVGFERRRRRCERQHGSRAARWPPQRLTASIHLVPHARPDQMVGT
jgi:protocatechuate 3,4-dioxygenase beta subunit